MEYQVLHLKSSLAKFCTQKNSLVLMKYYTFNSEKKQLENTCYATTL